MKYLITGSNGYIGNHLTEALLAQGATIHALVYPGTDVSNLQRDGVEIFTGDIRNYRAVAKAARGCDAAFHLASIVCQWAKDPAIFYEVNVEGTQNLLDVCLDEGIRRVLISSSCGIFGTSKNGELLDETTDNSRNLSNPYELSKYHQVEVAKTYLDRGLEIVFVYPTKVFGPGIKSEGSILHTIFEGVLRGTWKIIPGNGKNRNNYVFVHDVVQGMLLALEKGKSGEGYILGGHNLTTDELFALVQQAAGQRFDLTHIPYPVMWLIGAVAELTAKITGKKPFLTRHHARRVTAETRVSIFKSCHDLGFAPTPMDEALGTTLRDIQEKIASEELAKLDVLAPPAKAKRKREMVGV